MTTPSTLSLAFGVATKSAKNEIIEVYYPLPLRDPDAELVELVMAAFGKTSYDNETLEIDAQAAHELVQQLREQRQDEQANVLDNIASSSMPKVVCFIFSDTQPKTVSEVFLKLHLLSHRLALPNSLNLTGAFGV